MGEAANAGFYPLIEPGHLSLNGQVSSIIHHEGFEIAQRVRLQATQSLQKSPRAVIG
jgi:hypothetical protein